jgi:hypothetical protein
MITKFHPTLTTEKWLRLTQQQRMLNVASELTRVKNEIRDGENEYANQALERALDLIDLTVETALAEKKSSFLYEILRFREILASVYETSQKDEQKFLILLQAFLDLDPSVHNLQLELSS